MHRRTRLPGRRPVLALALAVGAVVATSGPVHAQSGETQIDEGQLLASAPRPGSSASSITFGAQLTAGRTETRGYSIDGVWARMSSGFTLVRFDASLTRAEFRPPNSQDRVTVEDSESLSAALVRPLKGPFSLLGEASWQRDKPLGLDQRLLAQAGLGFAIVRPGHLLFTVGSLVGVGRQDNAVADGDQIVNLGGTSSLSVELSPGFGLESSLSGYRDLDDEDDYRLDFSLSGTAKATSRLALKASFKWSEEGIHPADQSANTRKLELGATITLIGG